MPFCVASDSSKEEDGDDQGGVRIFYQRYGYGSTKVLLIIGFAGTYESWAPQIKGLTGITEPNDEETPSEFNGKDGEGIEICCFDNRGIGRSSIPTKKSQYTTVIMAKDALALMDHLGWEKAHIFGHSMGSMIASKLAAIAPHRVLSLALLNTSGGGFECCPKLNHQTVSLAYRFLRARTPEQRAIVDLEVHYTKEFLDERVGSRSRREILYQEYVKGLSSGMQSNHGFEGQINACWTHKLTRDEFDRIRSARILVSVIHGRDDVIARLCNARRLAEKLYPVARIIELHGGHLVSHERSDEVNNSLKELIRATQSKIQPEKWTNLTIDNNGWLVPGFSGSLSTRTDARVPSPLLLYHLLAKLQLIFLFILGVFVILAEYIKRLSRVVKPVRVSALTE